MTMTMIINNVAQPDIVARANALDDVCERLFFAGLAEGAASIGIMRLIREGLEGLTPALTAFNAAVGQLRKAYILGRVVSVFSASREQAETWLTERAYNASKCPDGKLQKGMRPQAAHRAIRNAESNFSSYLTMAGVDTGDARKENARKARTPEVPADATPDENGDQEQAAASAATPEGEAFTKDYDGFNVLVTFCASLDKATRQNPNGFNNGALLCAMDVVRRIRQMVRENADAANALPAMEPESDESDAASPADEPKVKARKSRAKVPA